VVFWLGVFFCFWYLVLGGSDFFWVGVWGFFCFFRLGLRWGLGVHLLLFSSLVLFFVLRFFGSWSWGCLGFIFWLTCLVFPVAFLWFGVVFGKLTGVREKGLWAFVGEGVHNAETERLFPRVKAKQLKVERKNAGGWDTAVRPSEFSVNWGGKNEFQNTSMVRLNTGRLARKTVP